MLALLGGVQCIGAFVLPAIPHSRASQRRYRVSARLSGGQDPHFSFGKFGYHLDPEGIRPPGSCSPPCAPIFGFSRVLGGKNPEKGKAQAPGALPENPTTTQALALRVQSFMTG